MKTICFVLLCFCSSITNGHQYDFTDAVVKVSPSVVTVLVARKDGGTGVGSGFVLRGGYIITNQHVTEGDGVTLAVEDKDGFSHQAIKVGEDATTDIAVLKIESTRLKPVKIGDPSKLKVGQSVLAFGSPYGLNRSVTAGIISSLRRKVPISKVTLIQSDASINAGNSGGPLTNSRGEVVAVNAYIYSPLGGSVGLSFSIPIDITLASAERLIAAYEAA